MIGYSSDTKPRVDSGGSALKIGSEFWERDSNRRFVWDGNDWQESVSQETAELRAIGQTLRQQNLDILRILASIHNGMVLAETILADPIEDLAMTG